MDWCLCVISHRRSWWKGLASRCHRRRPLFYTRWECVDYFTTWSSSSRSQSRHTFSCWCLPQGKVISSRLLFAVPICKGWLTVFTNSISAVILVPIQLADDLNVYIQCILLVVYMSSIHVYGCEFGNFRREIAGNLFQSFPKFPQIYLKNFLSLCMF